MTKANILIVEDERVVAADLEDRLLGIDYGVCGRVSSGEEALAMIEKDRPNLVIMDIKLEGRMDGIEAAGLIRERYSIPVVFLSAFSDEHILERAKITEPFGYLLKPLQTRELRSTIEIALYKYTMEEKLRNTNAKLEKALAEIKTLSGLLPICAKCKNIRDDEGYWNSIESYIIHHSEAEFSHSICPECAKVLYPDFYNEDS